MESSLTADLLGRKRMNGHFRNATKTRNDYVKFAVMEQNPYIWYIMIHGLEDEFKGGEYLLKVEAGANFPHEPPQFTVLTPNGVFATEGKVCISNGEYHKENYDMRLGMGGFTTNIISGLINWRQLGQGIGIMRTKVEEKVKYAADSKAYNMDKYPQIVAMIEESYSQYSTRW